MLLMLLLLKHVNLRTPGPSNKSSEWRPVFHYMKLK
jgi:hypothetical protein